MNVRHIDLTVPIMVHLEITTNCNHRCLHCYKLDSDISNRPIDIIDEEVVYGNAVKLIENHILQIVITGGEPFLRLNLLKRIINLANKSGVTVSVNTNLTLADDDIISFLKSTNTRILTSCPSGIENSFDKLTLTKNFKVFEKNLKKCIESGIKTSVNMVVTKDNLLEIIPTAEKIKALGCTSLCTTPVALNMDYPRPDLLLSIEDIHQLISDILWIENNLGMKVDILDGLPKCIFPTTILKEEHLFLYRRCQAGRTFVAVSPDGSVRPCANTSFSYGNINTESLCSIWERMYYWRSDKIIPKECNGCLWINRCLGGCRSNAYALKGKWNATDIWDVTPLKFAPPNHAKEVILLDSTILTYNQSISVRKENENAYLVYNVRNRTFCMINEPMLRFVEFVKSQGEVDYTEIVMKYAKGSDPKLVKNIISKLIQFKILKVNNKYGRYPRFQ